MRVTFTPMAANMEAYSQPITPPPITVRLAGMRSIWRIVSLSSTSGSAKGMLEGWKGTEPVATSENSPVMMRAPSGPVTSIAWGVEKRAAPRR